jgi:cell division protein FtsW
MRLVPGLPSIRSHHLLTLAVVALLGIGLLMVQSASLSVGANRSEWLGLTERAAKHGQFVVLGLLAYAITMRLPTERWLVGPAPREGESPIRRILRAPAFWDFAICAGLCFLVLIPGIGTEVNGARRWIKLGPVQLQPSELAKWAMVTSLTWWLIARPVDLKRFFPGFVVTMIPIGAVTLLVVVEDLGTAALIGVVAMLMLMVGRAVWWHLALIVPPALAAGLFFVMGTPYRWKRMTSFTNPWADPQGDGYHMIQSLMSFASGGFTGRGLGNGIQKLGYLPEDTTDFIFAVIAEELGFFGAATVACLLLGIVAIAWRLIGDERVSPAGKLLCFGVAATVGLQSCINVAVATVSMPTKGMSLPLVSAGGTGIILTCAMLGTIAGVSRRRVETATADDLEPVRSGASIA